ncbi:MAG TPA: GNAT family N-acetyltransferase [Burkholderiales bacterium]|jgi:acetyltransferase|nr:GNAT family N-acetyltransferase [Burkholderiales bacterium]
MTSPRYPFELVETYRLKGGRLVLIRPIHPQDETLVQSFVRELSPRSRRFRFHSAIRELDPRMLHAATHVDYRRHLALIAEWFDGEAETEIGAARYFVAKDGKTAEFAIAVADAWQRQGLARHLLERLSAIATQRGLQRLQGDVLEENQAMLGLAIDMGFEVREHASEPGIFVVERDLTGPVQPRPAEPRKIAGLAHYI